MSIARMPGLYKKLVFSDLNKQRVIRDRSDPRDLFSDMDFRRKFRFKKESMYGLVELIGPELFTITERHFAVPALLRLCILLRFLGSGSHYEVIADSMGIVKSTVCEILKCLIPIVAGKAKDFIKFLKTLDEKNRIKREFYVIKGTCTMAVTSLCSPALFKILKMALIL